MPPEPTMRPYGRHLLLCAGETCTSAEAGARLAARAIELLGDRRDLHNPEHVKCSTIACLDACSDGPIAVVYPDGIWYYHVDEALLERIVSEHLIGGQPVAEAIFHRLYPVGQEPPYAPTLRADPPSESQTAQGSVELEDREPTHSPAPADTPPDATAEPPEVPTRHVKKGLVIVNTGNGKGKTSAALGVMTRAWGRGMRVQVVQFFKHENARFGETRAAEKMGIPFGGTGDGFTWTSKDMDETQARALRGWELAQQIIRANEHEIVILDEFTYLMAFGWLPVAEVVAWLAANKPPMMHVIITGRDAPPELIDHADLVTEMREIKHPFASQGIRAQPGIEF